jgi:hypothetical protein
VVVVWWRWWSSYRSSHLGCRNDNGALRSGFAALLVSGLAIIFIYIFFDSTKAHFVEAAMARRRISSSDLIWMFHERLKEYDDHPFTGVALAVIPIGNGEWAVAMTRRVPRRKPDMATRISAIEKQLQKQYTLAAE